MSMSIASPALIAATFAATLLAASLVLRNSTAEAQVFGPPMTAFGSIADDQGIVEAGLVVEAYVGNTVCGKGATEFTGEPPGRVTVYWVDVVSREQTPGCGSNGGEVRIKIGDRFAPRPLLWQAGPVRHDVTFGNATPAPIPTPTPVRDQATQPPATQPPASTPVPGGGGRGGDSSATPSASASPTETATPAHTATPSPTATLAGRLVTREAVTLSSAQVEDESGDDGFPVWAMVLIGLGTVVAAGGGIGFAMARARRDDDDQAEPPAAQ